MKPPRLLATMLGIAISSAALLVPTLQPASASVSPVPIRPVVVAPHSPDGYPAGPVGPEFHTWPLARAYAEAHLGARPRGVNPSRCTPKAGQAPVVLVPGTAEDAFSTWSLVAPHLAARGLCVYTLNVNPAVGVLSEAAAFTGDIRASAQFLGGFVDDVLAQTGAERVDLVGHSQGGGILPMTYLKRGGGAAKVRKLIGIAPSHHGTTASGLTRLVEQVDAPTQTVLSAWADAHNLTAFGQQMVGSDLVGDIYGDGDAVPGVAMTTITTRLDEVVTPASQGQLEGATNVVLQDLCPLNTAMHIGAAYDPVTLQVLLNTLDPTHATPIRCAWIPPYLPRPAGPVSRQ